MATVIYEKQRQAEGPPRIFREIFSPCLCIELEEIYRRGIAVDEVRLRANRQASVSSGGENIFLEYTVGQAELEKMLNILCGGSLYAHADTLNSGYITVHGGIRVGVAGRASCQDGKIVGIYDICALCFRLPKKVLRVGAPVCKLLRESGRGVLVYSPPAQGKTTLLRAVTAQMSSGQNAWRVCVIDSRGELAYSLEDKGLCVDMLVGYPRSAGLEIATRCLNAQLIVCDEIGTREEAETVISLQNCGVPLLASAHASSLESLYRRGGLAELCRAGVFGSYVGIRRRMGESDYEYTIDTET